LVQSLTKWTTTASRRVRQVLARALDTALAPRPGPVLLELRDDVAAQAPLTRPRIGHSCSRPNERCGCTAKRVQ